jgi:hypothetical protein
MHQHEETFYVRRINNDIKLQISIYNKLLFFCFFLKSNKSDFKTEKNVF